MGCKDCGEGRRKESNEGTQSIPSLKQIKNKIPKYGFYARE